MLLSYTNVEPDFIIAYLRNINPDKQEKPPIRSSRAFVFYKSLFIGITVCNISPTLQMKNADPPKETENFRYTWEQKRGGYYAHPSQVW
jgi:hypothetical protein